MTLFNSISKLTGSNKQQQSTITKIPNYSLNNNNNYNDNIITVHGIVVTKIFYLNNGGSQYVP